MLAYPIPETGVVLGTQHIKAGLNLCPGFSDDCTDGNFLCVPIEILPVPAESALGLPHAGKLGG